MPASILIAATSTKQRIKYLAHKTFTKGVLSEIGGFGGLFSVDKKYLGPGAGFERGRRWDEAQSRLRNENAPHRGCDLVNHCVNDIAVQGAAPLFFMDYLATGTLDSEVAEKIVGGLAEACKHNGCALDRWRDGRNAGVLSGWRIRLAGFIVGVVERDHIISGKDVQIGDCVLGLPSNGLHTNGYSLARKLLFEIAGYSPETFVSEIKNKVGNELMRTHRSYWSIIRKMIAGECVAALAHVTGGGITENLPRVLPKGTSAVIELGTVAGSADFRTSAEAGKCRGGGNAPHLQHGAGHAGRGSGQEVQESADAAGAGGRKVLQRRADCQRRS
jgi:phosphoribosylformylglycinamidine cyclo-ligase